MQDRILDLLMNQDEISWQSIIYDLVKTEQMDPWDVNVSLLAQRFLDRLREFKGMDLKVSGKVVLAAAILLKIKSKRLVGADLDNLDRMFAQGDESEEEMYDELMKDGRKEREPYDPQKLIPRTPQPRKRKVSIYDLVGALQKAMEVKKRKIIREIPPMEIDIPEKKFDIGDVIKNVYGRIKFFFTKNQGTKLTFSKLLPENASKDDKVYTFIPLLHLTNQRKIDLEQEQHFEEIEIVPMRPGAVQVEETEE